MTDDTARIKSAASLLMKGGTLTDDPCPKCGGVQVRFVDKTSCINCGNEAGKTANIAAKEQPPTAQGLANLASASALIEEKIAFIASEVMKENDILVQKQKAELLESYLRILEKMKSLIG